MHEKRRIEAGVDGSGEEAEDSGEPTLRVQYWPRSYLPYEVQAQRPPPASLVTKHTYLGNRYEVDTY